MIVPFSAGGPADVLGRLIAEKLTRSLGQTVVVINKDGAGTILGVDMAAKATPDGYTLLLGNVAMVINSSAGKRLPYTLQRDLVPVSLAFTQPLILVINPALPIANLKEFIAYAKANPGKLKYGSSGIGTSIHLTSELFRNAAGIDLTHIPYKGAAPALTDLLGGQTQIMFASLVSALPHVRQARLRALGVTTMKRAAALPEVPAISESGLRGYDVSVWMGIVAPAGTPPAIIAQLNRQIAALLQSPDIRERLAVQGLEAASKSPAEFRTYIASEVRKWAVVIKQAGVVAD
ncbi:MAG TPA: tripartite tricarboxylate transporter substrate binding protein [Burkholderiales bacterium]|nr:tripartite tricarboxylate transporter substrate binding protein [Burkholderiales bacterium]